MGVPAPNLKEAAAMAIPMHVVRSFGDKLQILSSEIVLCISIYLFIYSFIHLFIYPQ